MKIECSEGFIRTHEGSNEHLRPHERGKGGKSINREKLVILTERYHLSFSLVCVCVIFSVLGLGLNCNC